MYIFLGLVFYALIAIVPAKVAERKGKSFGLWYLYGFALWIIAIIHALSLPEIYNDNMSRNIKKEPDVIKDVKSDKVDLNAKVRILTWSILKDDTEKCFLKMSFKNISDKKVEALDIIAKGYDSFGNEVIIDGKSEFNILVQDLSLLPNEKCQNNIIITLTDSRIRKLELKINKICYANGQVEFAGAEEWVKNCQNPLPAKYLQFVQLENRIGKYFMIDADRYWQCVCGEVNNRSLCINCEMQKNQAQKYSASNIESIYRIDLQEQREQEDYIKEKNREQEIYKNKVKQKITKISAIVIGVCIAFVLLYVFPIKIIASKNYFDKAKECITEKKLDEAKEYLEKSKDSVININNYSALDELYFECGATSIDKDNKLANECFENIDNLETYRTRIDELYFNYVIQSIEKKDSKLAKRYYIYIEDPELYKSQIQKSCIEKLSSLKLWDSSLQDFVLSLRGSPLVPVETVDELYNEILANSIRQYVEKNDFETAKDCYMEKSRFTFSKEDYEFGYTIACKLMESGNNNNAYSVFMTLKETEYSDVQERINILKVKNDVSKGIIPLSTLEHYDMLDKSLFSEDDKAILNEAKDSINMMQGCFMGGRPYYYSISGYKMRHGDETLATTIYFSYNLASHRWEGDCLGVTYIQVLSENEIKDNYFTYTRISNDMLPSTF